jgi:glycosyltransferase involved in cell wall biosynthesis
MPIKTVACLTSFWKAPDAPFGAEADERFVCALARTIVLASAGRWRVNVIVYGPQPSCTRLSPGVVLQVLRANGPLPHLEHLSWDLPQAIAEADLIHVHHGFSRTCDAAMLCAKLSAKPTCATLRGASSAAPGLGLRGIAMADTLLAPSQFVLNRLRGQVRIEERGDKPIRIAKGGVDTAFSNANPQTRQGVLFVGRLLPSHGVDQLMHALPEGVPLTICGPSCPFHLDYLVRLRSLSSGKEVRFVSEAPAEAVRELYQRACALVAPAVHEDCYGSPRCGVEIDELAMLEAMACETPVLCAATACAGEFVDHQKTGLHFDSREELRGQIERITSDGKLVARLGGAARQSVLDNFGVAMVASIHVQAYDELLGLCLARGDSSSSLHLARAA